MANHENLQQSGLATGSGCMCGRQASLGMNLIDTMRRDKQDVLRALSRASDPAQLLGDYYERVDAALSRLRHLRQDFARQAAGLGGGASGIAPEHQALPWDEDFLGRLEIELRIGGRWTA